MSKAIIKENVFVTRGQIFDGDGRKVCNLPNDDIRADVVELGREVRRRINHYPEMMSLLKESIKTIDGAMAGNHYIGLPSLVNKIELLISKAEQQ